jgi:hypothetical protein
VKKTLRALLPVALPFLVSVALAVTPVIPWTKSLWKFNDAAAFYAQLTTFIGIDFALIVATFGYLFARARNDVVEELCALADRVPGSTIRWIDDRAFYRDFLSAIEASQHAVRIAYFAPIPPDAVQVASRGTYYRDLAEIMRSRSTVQFSRLVRYTEANQAWIVGLMREFQDVGNVSIAVISNDLDPTQSMPLALSVQVVDEESAWLVAIAAHERTGPVRDLFVENPAFADAMTQYYTRLWAAADVLLDHGRMTESGERMSARESHA